MKPVDDIEQHEIEEQIQIRKDLLGCMVGTLYPPIIIAEIAKLSKRRGDFLTEKEMKV